MKLAADTDGSRYQGPSPDPSASWFGVSSIAEAVTLVAIAATLAPSPGSSAFESVVATPAAGCAGGAAAVLRAVVPEVRGAAGAGAVAGVLESHCRGAGERKRAVPLSSVTVSAPAWSLVTVRPCAAIGKVSDFRAGFWAASLVRTMMTSRQPPWVRAVSCRSTPGRTSG